MLSQRRTFLATAAARKLGGLCRRTALNMRSQTPLVGEVPPANRAHRPDVLVRFTDMAMQRAPMLEASVTCWACHRRWGGRACLRPLLHILRLRSCSSRGVLLEDVRQELRLSRTLKATPTSRSRHRTRSEGDRLDATLRLCQFSNRPRRGKLEPYPPLHLIAS